MTNGDQPSSATEFFSFCFFFFYSRRRTGREDKKINLKKRQKNKTAHLLPCHLALAARGAVDVAACLPMAMEQLHYLLVNSSVRSGMCNAQ